MLVLAGGSMLCDVTCMRCLEARTVTIGCYILCGPGWPRELFRGKLGETTNGIGTCGCVSHWHNSLC